MARFTGDRLAYTEGKAAFIAQSLELARAEGQGDQDK
jgi:hypothetical protein